MSTIDELVKQHSKVPGDIKVTYDKNKISTLFFIPYFKDIDGLWHGLNQSNVANQRLSYSSDWQLYTEPKKKVRLYKWAFKNTMSRSGWTETTDFHHSDKSDVSKAFSVGTEIMRLDYTMIEVGDE